MNKPICFGVLMLVTATLIASDGLPADSPDKSSHVDFAREILPILSNKCFVCHGPDAKDEDLLRLDAFATAIVDLGGYRAIDPAEPEKSRILVRIHSTDDPMPPADVKKQLTEKERDLISRWVRQGGEYARHWAFVPPRKPANAMAYNDIDDFVLERIVEAGFGFAPLADRATLARRAALVLTGLPPEPEQLARLLAAERKEAYHLLVDDLLNSKRFGEHQARYWLEAVRYGDTHGLHLDNRRGIYPYRDWVVRAMNRNMPLDDFITWQLAGDLLPSPTLAQRVAFNADRWLLAGAQQCSALRARRIGADLTFSEYANIGVSKAAMEALCRYQIGRAHV